MKKPKASRIVKVGSISLVTAMLLSPVSAFAAENHDHSGTSTPSSSTMSGGSTTSDTSMPGGSTMEGMGMDDMMDSMGMSDMMDGMMGDAMSDDSAMTSDSSTTGGSMMDDMDDMDGMPAQLFAVKGMVHGVSADEQVTLTLMSGMDIIKETTLAANGMDFDLSGIPAGEYMLYVNINNVTVALKHVTVTNGNVTVDDVDLHTVSGTITGIEPGATANILLVPSNVQMGMDMAKPLVLTASENTIPFTLKAAVGSYTLKVTAPGYADNQSTQFILGHQDSTLAPIQLNKGDTATTPPASGDTGGSMPGMPGMPGNGGTGSDTGGSTSGGSTTVTIPDSQTFAASFTDTGLMEAIDNSGEMILLDAGLENTKVSFDSNQISKLMEANKPIALSVNGVELTFDPMIFDVMPNSQVTVNVQKMDAGANQSLPQGSGYQVAESFYEFKIIMDDGSMPMELKKFSNPVNVTLPVPDSYWLDGSHQALDVFYVNNTDGTTESMQAIHDPEKKNLTFTTTHFSNYALLDVTKQPLAQSFGDLQNHWAKKDIAFMAAKGYVSGYEDKSFRPEAGITKAEFTAILARMLNLKESAEITFQDVKQDDWFASSIAKAYKAGIVQGDSSTTFQPLEQVTREQMAAMIAKALTYAKGDMKHSPIASTEQQMFTDNGDVSDWAKDSVTMMAHAKIISGVEGSDGVAFYPKKTASRAEAATMLARLNTILVQP